MMTGLTITATLFERFRSGTDHRPGTFRVTSDSRCGQNCYRPAFRFYAALAIDNIEPRRFRNSSVATASHNKGAFLT
ncbi:uncharacterized protein ARMOST_18745 [Armillaria ostoyae]|uniref:Uncharacterized protein n=1 Tax=Armillaria ostoyae TaxID=47428 RepID=A0A284S2R6_ARMOS|nr:uncharacterized protein ARMOST_18745 [Armillaria ostoyae]